MLHLSGNMVFRSVFTRDAGEQYIILIYMKETGEYTYYSSRGHRILKF